MLLKSCFVLSCLIIYTECLYITGESESWPANVQIVAEREEFLPVGLARRNVGYKSAAVPQETVIVMPNQAGYPATRGSYGYGTPAMNRGQTVIVNRQVPENAGAKKKKGKKKGCSV